MTDLDTIFDNNWDEDNTDKPAIVRDEITSLNIYNRAVTCRLLRKEEDYMGIISRDKYTPDSHDGWVVRVVSTTQSDATDIINETRRIIAKYDGSDEDRFATWEIGEWEVMQPFRWEFRFIVLVKKSGMDYS